jgi:hypothetical protein
MRVSTLKGWKNEEMTTEKGLETRGIDNLVAKSTRSPSHFEAETCVTLPTINATHPSQQTHQQPQVPQQLTLAAR